MNILLLGGGGREHALAWKIEQSPFCDELFIAPGNAGTKAIGKNLPVDPNDFQAVKKAVLDKAIDLVIVGPEDPLVNGIYDFFQDDPSLQGIPLVGPSKAAARLEGSKAFAKAFMKAFDIPTAGYREFSRAELEEGLEYLKTVKAPYVLKADGLAAGKGVLIINDLEKAQEEFKAMLEGKFGSAGEKVVIEEFLSGVEFSVFVLTDGKDYQLLPVAKDYKRVGVGDTGLNTGGMGAISSPPFVDKTMMEKVRSRIIEPTIKGLQSRNMVYKGFIFFGLISVEGEPYVIEYNCRLGDPETQVILPRLRSDLLELLLALSRGRLAEVRPEVDQRAAATVILVSGGYPEAYEKGNLIKGLEAVEGCQVFLAGAQEENGLIKTSGGRVLAITTLADDFKEAVAQSMKAAAVIDFEKKYYRTDIGFDL